MSDPVVDEIKRRLESGGNDVPPPDDDDGDGDDDEYDCGRVDWECNACGIEVCVPAAWLLDKQRTGRRFWCPNGHPWVYEVAAAPVKPDTRSRLRKLLDAMKGEA